MTGALRWDRDRGAGQIPELSARREALSHGRFRVTSVKIMQDGVAENFTAAMTSPYLDACGHATGNTGLSFIDPHALRSYVTELDALDFQVHFHALGDRAVRESLDAVEAARTANGRRATWPTCRSSTPTTSRASRAWRDRQHPAALGRPRTPDGRVDDPLPGARTRHLAVPFRRPLPRRRHSCGGQ